MNARQHPGAGTSPVPAMTKECQVKDHDILCIGDVNVDLILAGVTRLPDFGEEVLAEAMGMHLGGCTANVATFAARLGLQSALRARVGEDDFGTFVLEGLNSNGVSTAHIIRDGSLRTGLTVSISGPRDRAFVTYLGTIDSLTGADVSDELLLKARHVHIGSYFLQSKLRPAIVDICLRARELGITTSLDTGYDPSQKWDSGVREAIRAVDYFLPNEVEAAAVSGIDDPLKAARGLARGGTTVALKLGAAGSFLVGPEGEFRSEGFRVEVVDTTCCGDAFNAGFLAAILAGLGGSDALRWGNAVGAIVAGGQGTSAHRLSRPAVEELLSG